MKKLKTSSLPSRISAGFLVVVLIASSVLSAITLLTLPEQPAKADSYLNQTANKDTTLKQGAPTTNYGYDTYLRLADSSSFESHMILEFDISDLPDGATVTSATFSLYYYQNESGQPWPDTVDCHRLTRTNWVESQATWNIYKTSNSWSTSGGDYDTGITASTTIPSVNNWMTFTVTDHVQDAIDNRGDIVGLYVAYHTLDEGTFDISRYYSAEYTTSSYRPKLEIEYTPLVISVPTVTTSAATSIEETTTTLNGNVTDTGNESNDEQGFYYDIDSGTPYASNQTSSGSFGTGTFDEDITGLTQGELYYFQAISHNSEGWGNGLELTFFTKPLVGTNFNAVSGGCGTINLSWTKGTGADNTEIWGQTGSYPTRGVGTLTYNSTGTSHSDTNPVTDETWYYRAWSWATEGGLSQYSDDYIATTGASSCQIPTLTTYNATSIEETTVTLNGSITNVGLENADYRGFEWDTNTGSPYTYNWTQDGDYGTGIYTYNSTGLTEGELYYYRSVANNSDGWGYGNEVTFLTKPRLPTSFTNTSASSTTIDFSWTNGNGAQKVLIRYGNATNPTTISEGTQGFFNTGTTGTVSSLSVNTSYYFSAWSYATEGGLTQYSDTYATINTSTILGPVCITLDATNAEETTVTLQANTTVINGGNIITRGFEWDTNSGIPYTVNWTQAGNYSIGTFSHGLTLLTKGDVYYYRAMVENDNNDWGYGDEVKFITKPDEPTTLTVTAYTYSSLSLSWVKGDGADNTIIHYSTTGYPTDYIGVTGTEAYNGIGTSTVVTSLNPGQIYYFSAWSYTEEDSEYSYSDAYDTVTDYTSPADVASLDAFNPSYSTIDLSWLKGTGGDQSHIRGQATGYPTDVADGTQIYFGTASSTIDTSLTSNTTYYYRAWAYDSDSGYYSDGYDQDYEATTTTSSTPTPTPTPTPGATTTTEDTGTMFIAFVLLPLGLFTIGLYWKKIWIVSAASIAFFGLGMFGLTEGSAGEGLWIIGMLCTIFAMLVALFAFFRMREKDEPIEEGIALSPDEEYENELNSERKSRKQARKERRDEGL